MAESSARGVAKLPQSGGNSTSTSTAAGQSGTGPRHRSERLKSWLKRPFNPPKTSSTSSLSATEKDTCNEPIGHGLSSTGFASGKKHDASSGDGSTPHNGNAFAGFGRGCEEAVPIAELWNHAYEQLREKEPNLIEKYEAEVSLQVSSVVGITVAISGLGKVQRREQMEVLVKHKLEEDQDGKWRIPLGKDHIAIRDLAGYVVSIVDWGKDFVGAALESSPYGSIAWAGVCLILPLILNPSKQRASNVRGLEYISDLLSRCAMYEYAYYQRYEMNRDGTSNKLDLASDCYHSTLKELYLRILKFQAQSVCQLSRNIVSGGVRAMFKIDDWDNLLDNIKSQEANCQRFFDSVKDEEAFRAREEGHRQRISLLLDKLEELNHGIKGIRNKLEDIHFSDEESNCFETLRTSNYLARKDLNPERLPGTCKWFLDHPKYQDWIAQTPASRLLWVSADPGCGKSVLAKALVDQYSRGSVCYYFFKDDTTITRSASHAICAILHQICDLRPVLIKHILPLYRRNGGKLVDLFEDLWSAFADIISDKDFGNVICILDAIDECSDDYKKLLERLAAIATSSTSIKILITSRPYTSIEIALFHKTGLDKNEIRLSGEAVAEQSIIEKEVGFFISSKIQEFRNLRESIDIRDNVHKRLQFHFDGVKNRTYLWVSAVFNELERDVYASEYVLMDTINALPDNVHKAYENILEKSPKKPMLKRVLHIMLAAFRPLSVMEMNVVLSIQDTSGSSHTGLQPENSFCTWLRDLCGFFINIVENKLYFAHQTAREFLVGEAGYQSSVGWRGSFQLADSHTLLARICINYLLLLYGGSLDATVEIYATIYWPAHCQRLEMDRSLADKVKGFLFHKSSASSPFASWATAAKRLFETGLEMDEDYSIKHSIGSPPTPLFLACKFGWPSVIHVLSSSDIDWNTKNDEEDTGLIIAAQKGHLEIVDLFLNAEADFDAQNKVGETALHNAARENHLEIAKHLLNAGADFNIQDSYDGDTALLKAATWGHLEMTKLLLTAGADVNEDIVEETALHRAGSKGHLEIVELLLMAGADVNIQNDRTDTALHLALKAHFFEIAKLLLTPEADVNIQDSSRRTALHFAVGADHLEIVKLLLNAGVDVNIQDHKETTALHQAVSRNHIVTVKLLLEAGADVNITNNKGRTALHLAVVGGHLEIVNLLMTAGADPHITDHKLDDPLYLAVLRNRLDIAQVLLTGADVNKREFGGTALNVAVSLRRPRTVKVSDGYRWDVSKEDVEMVKLLLAAGADVNVQNYDRNTPLHSAAKDLITTWKFLLREVDLYDTPDEENAALRVALNEAHLEIVKVLLAAGADVNVQNDQGETALHFATKGDHPEIVKLLLVAGAAVNVQNDKGKTALHLAAEGDHFKTVKLLSAVDDDYDPDVEETLLRVALKEARLETVETLLKAGADVNIQTRKGQTALQFAIEGDYLETLKLLLKAGDDVNVQNTNGDTALHFAARDLIETTKPFSTVEDGYETPDVENTALHVATLKEAHLEVVRLFLAAGADVTVQNAMGNTALHFAVEGDHLETLKLLLAAGAEVNVQNTNGDTALHFTVQGMNRLEAVKLLLAAGADVNVQNTKGNNTLHFAVGGGHLETVKLLLAAGADVTVQNTKGITALHFAVGGHLETVKLLLAAGADVNVQSTNGSTALHFAVEGKNRLETAGASDS